MQNTRNKVVSELPVTVWNGCYASNWNSLIVPDAFSHPAKMARGLCERIFDYAFEKGWLKKGDVVVDPFGGIFSTGIVGASRGVRVFGCELESRFVELAHKNIELHRRTWEACGDPLPVCVQGDSRRLCEVLEPQLAACVVSSPPFSQSQQSRDGDFVMNSTDVNPTARKLDTRTYFPAGQDSGGNLAALPTGSVDSIISSPPYSSEGLGHGGRGNDPGIPHDSKDRLGAMRDGYGTAPGNLGNLPAGDVAAIVSSPPFLDDLSRVSRRGIGSAEYGNGTMTKEIRLAWANLDHEAFGTYLRERRESLGLSKAEVDRRIGTNTAYSFYEGRKGSQDQWRVPLPSTYRKIKDVLQLDDRFDSVLLSTTVIEYERRAMKMGHTEDDYGETPGQLGGMRAGDVAAVIGSPPFAGSGVEQDGRKEIVQKQFNESGKPGSRPNQTGDYRKNSYSDTYGQTPGQLGAMPPGDVADALISSPPFMLSDNRDVDETFAYKFHGDQRYSEETPVNSSIGGDRTSDDAKQQQAVRAQSVKNLGNIVSTGNCGTLVNTDTFWSASIEILRQCYAILRPGGIAIFVCKDFVRAGKRVQFSQQWQTACIHVGFVPVEEIHASLVKEHSHPGLFGTPVVKRTERKGFFRRLHQKKFPHLAIDWEVVLILQKPALETLCKVSADYQHVPSGKM